MYYLIFIYRNSNRASENYLELCFKHEKIRAATDISLDETANVHVKRRTIGILEDLFLVVPKEYRKKVVFNPALYVYEWSSQKYRFRPINNSPKKTSKRKNNSNKKSEAKPKEDEINYRLQLYKDLIRKYGCIPLLKKCTKFQIYISEYQNYCIQEYLANKIRLRLIDKNTKVDDYKHFKLNLEEVDEIFKVLNER